jgi:hypothetical protein
MIRSSLTTILFAALLAGPAVAESNAPATSPESTAAPATTPAATDAFGLPCEVTFAPKTATPAKGKSKKVKDAKPAPTTYHPSGIGRGAEFALGRVDRGPSYQPNADAEVHMKAVTLTPAMAGLVVRDNATAIELCMTKLPREARVGTVGLVMTIEPTGVVSAAKVNGAPKAAAFSSCLAGAAKTWAFPHTDAAAEIEYPITLNGR